MRIIISLLVLVLGFVGAIALHPYIGILSLFSVAVAGLFVLVIMD